MTRKTLCLAPECYKLWASVQGYASTACEKSAIRKKPLTTCCDCDHTDAMFERWKK